MRKKLIKYFLVIFGVLVIIGIIAVIVFAVTTTVTAEPATLSTEARQGKNLFLTTANCSHCHLQGGRESLLGFPALSTSHLDDASMFKIIRAGKGSMPANQSLSNTEVNLIIAYLKAIRVTI